MLSDKEIAEMTDIILRHGYEQDLKEWAAKAPPPPRHSIEPRTTHFDCPQGIVTLEDVFVTVTPEGPAYHVRMIRSDGDGEEVALPTLELAKIFWNIARLHFLGNGREEF